MFWLLISVCFLLSFLLSGLESAVTAVSRVRVRHAAGAGDRRARGLLPLIEDREALLGCVTVANHIVNLTGFLLVALPLIRHASVEQVAVTFVVALPLFLVGLEVLPKKLFRRFPWRSMRRVAPLLHVVGLARPLFRAFIKPRSSPELDAPLAAETGGQGSQGRLDLKALAVDLAAEQQLSPFATRIITNILDYQRRKTGDVMTPLNRSVALPADLPVAAALIVAREQQSALLPVLGDDGAFIGVLDANELPPALPPDRLVRQHMRTLDTVHAEDPALRTLQRLRKLGRRMAVVMDAQNRPVGLVSEDQLLAPLMEAPGV
ncbi:MAG: DUF21 domain-containing protein [Verrucomicrobiaceae bacterium]|nr:DUF21 domain-containing protein [Verrucomicrobiaceae bacterium]